MTQAAHATLGASSAHRWLACPGSVRMSKGMPNESSVHARTGSCAHSVAEMCLNSGKDAIAYLGCEIPEYEDIDVDEEMCEAVQVYLDLIREEIAKYTEEGHNDYDLGVEVRFDLSHVHPEMFGTCDAVLYFPAWRKLIVFDYKHGWTSVAVERNPQTMYYAVGALTGKHNRSVASVELVIVQPRSGQHAAIKRWDCDPMELLDFIGDLKNGAAATEKPDAPLHAGDWCKWCPAVLCPEQERSLMELAMAEHDIDGTVQLPDPAKIPLPKLKVLWENADRFDSWIKNIKSLAHTLALQGQILPGCKLVEGRSRRNWKDEADAEARLKQLEALGQIDSAFVTKLKSPSQVETQLGKKNKGMIADMWNKGQGALSLVSEKDERAPAKADALTEFS